MNIICILKVVAKSACERTTKTKIIETGIHLRIVDCFCFEVTSFNFSSFFFCFSSDLKQNLIKTHKIRKDSTTKMFNKQFIGKQCFLNIC